MYAKLSEKASVSYPEPMLFLPKLPMRCGLGDVACLRVFVTKDGPLYVMRALRGRKGWEDGAKGIFKILFERIHYILTSSFSYRNKNYNYNYKQSKGK